MESFDQEVVQKRWKEDSPKLLNEFLTLVKEKESLEKHDYEEILHKVAENNNVGGGKIIHPLRLAVSGMGVGPGLYDILDIIGKINVIKRIEKILEVIK